MGSIIEILNNIGKDDYINNKTYRAVDIESVYIDNTEFKNYGAYSFIWEKTYVKSPERSASGSIGNLNSYATFLTPHLIIDFSIMSIDDYRTIMRMHYEKNEFIVKCYDPIYNKTIKVKMYFATEEMAKLYTISQHRLKDSAWEDWVDIVGVREYKVELIGTNNDIDFISVRYLVNAPTTTVDGITTTLAPDIATDGGSEDVYMGEQVIIDGADTNIVNETFGGKKKFVNWNTSPDGKGQTYSNGYAYTINSDLMLYAIWTDMSEYILTFNYGIADPAVNNEDYSYDLSRKVTYDNPIGELPKVAPPAVEVKNGETVEKKYPYINPEWWKTPIKTKTLDNNGNETTEGLVVTDDTKYWIERDSTIYLLFDKEKYDLAYYIDGKEYIAAQKVEFNTPLLFPNPDKTDSVTNDDGTETVTTTFYADGWYTTQDYKEGTKFSGNMPPYPLNLYARWVKKS